jgi:hypothetical protein
VGIDLRSRQRPISTSLLRQFGLFIKLCLIGSSFTFAVVLIFLGFFEVMQKIVEIRK